MTMTRSEYVEWAKRRALDMLDQGEDPTAAYTSMVSDLTGNPETKNHAGIQLGMALLMVGDLNTEPKMRKFIEGFH